MKLGLSARLVKPRIAETQKMCVDVTLAVAIRCERLRTCRHLGQNMKHKNETPL